MPPPSGEMATLFDCGDDEVMDAALSDLARILGSGALIQAPPSRALCSDDTASAGRHGTADAVVHPQNAAQVGSVISWARRNEVSLVPRGGGTGYAGGAAPPASIAPCVVLATDQLRGRADLTPESWRATFSAGFTNHEVRSRCSQAGLFFGPNPGSAEACLIGGNVATNASGPRSFKYGPTRAWVSGLEVVLGTGELVRLGGETRKSVETLDLVGLFCGSEGTLGVVTEVTLQLQPAPELARPLLAIYPDRASGLAASLRVLACGVVPTAFEFLEGSALRAGGGMSSLGIELDFDPSEAGVRGADEPFALMLESLGSESVVAAETAVLRQALMEESIHVLAPETRAEVEALWRWRDGVSLAVTAIRGGKLSDDIAVPLEHMDQALAGLDEIARSTGTEITSWGHIGDGILHATVLLDLDDPLAVKESALVAGRFLILAKQLGGSLSGEHGIGRIKAEAASELPETLVSAQDAVKQALDPSAIMNPGCKLQ